MKNQIQYSDAKALLLAGSALITVQSGATGDHLTYRIKKAKDKELFFVSVLTGPSSYSYMGVIADTAKPEIKLTGKSRISEKAKSYQVLSWVLRNLGSDNLNQATLMHNGLCCKCGRTLTTPESIERGIGPRCAGFMG